MSSRIRLSSAVAAVIIAGALAGCSSPSGSPEPGSDPSPTAPMDAPVGTGEFVPDEDWFAGLDAARSGLEEYVGWWGTQECTYQKVIDGDFNCTIHISGIQEQVLAVDSYLVDVVNIAPGSQDLVAGLQETAAVSAEAAAAAEALSTSGCDFSPGESCTSGADALVDLAGQLDVALAGWETPPLG
ncbi:hypothetical protein [Schumannella luteola]